MAAGDILSLRLLDRGGRPIEHELNVAHIEGDGEDLFVPFFRGAKRAITMSIPGFEGEEVKVKGVFNAWNSNATFLEWNGNAWEAPLVLAEGLDVIQDRTIYEDAHIFAPNLHAMEYYLVSPNYHLDLIALSEPFYEFRLLRALTMNSFQH